MKKTKKEQEYRLALLWISTLGKGIKESLIDWQNIGKMAVKKAQETLSKKCKTCGKIL